jgi:sigma-E factor negative regulatory protein RseC
MGSTIRFAEDRGCEGKCQERFRIQDARSRILDSGFRVEDPFLPCYTNEVRTTTGGQPGRNKGTKYPMYSWCLCVLVAKRYPREMKQVTKEKGIIEEVVGNTAMIRVMKTGACAGCTEKDACHMRIGGNKPMIIDVENDLGATAGDWVEISMPAQNVMKLSFIVYFLPVLAFILAAAIGAELGPLLHLTPDVGSIAFGGATLLVSFLLLKRLNKNVRKNSQYYPRMTRIVPPDSC